MSGRFFTPDEIADTVGHLRDGSRQRGANALSGALRIGPDAYFLLRWDGRDGKAWAEVLVRAPLQGESLGPQVLGRFGGISTAYKPVDNRLMQHDGVLLCIVRQGERWGLARYDVKTEQFRFHPLGGRLLTYTSTDPQTATFVERTGYGTSVAGRLDLPSGFRRSVFEGRGTVRFLDAQTPPIILASSNGRLRAINAETGGELRLGSGMTVGRAGEYLVAWSPPGAPRSATAYSLGRGNPVARWRAR